jgi:cytochrome c oxidase accessory protein FixG
MSQPAPKDDFRSTLRTIDAKGNRNWVYADVVGGAWRRRRTVLAIALVGFFLAAPWIVVDGYPLMQVDFFHRKLVLLGKVFLAHELNLFITAVLGTIFGIYALTAWGGRVFCGWVCPHNTWLESVFRPLEQWIEGRANQRRSRDKQGVSAHKVFRKTLKWTIFVLIAFVMANTSIAWIVSGARLKEMVLQPPSSNLGLFIGMAVTTALFAFNFGWFREQTCLIVCPYGRLQGVLLDKLTLIVGYDKRRGEPRGRLGTPGAGDCTNCRRCVTVCPTGIDIRDGLQLECIGCTACIDACDDQMLKIKKPKGLIRYTTESELEGELPKRHTRPLIYMGLSLLLIAVAGLRIVLRSDFDATLMRGGVMNFTVSGDTVQNYLSVRVDNTSRDTLDIAAVSESEGVTVFVPPTEKTRVAPLSSTEFGMFVRVPKSTFHRGTREIEVRLEAGNGHRESSEKLKFTVFGPEG